MISRDKAPKYAVVNVENEDDLRATRPAWPTHNYKPAATKAPTLLVFVVLLALCVGAFELVLQRSVKPSLIGSDENTAVTLTKRNPLDQRATTTTPPGVCVDYAALLSRKANADDAWQELCAELKTFDQEYPGPPSLRTSVFDQWVLSWTSVVGEWSTALTSLRHITSGCVYRGGRTITITPVPPEGNTMLGACTTQFFSDPGCWGSVAFTLENNTVTSSVVAVCAVAVTEMLSNASPQRTTTTPTRVLLTITVDEASQRPDAFVVTVLSDQAAPATTVEAATATSTQSYTSSVLSTSSSSSSSSSPSPSTSTLKETTSTVSTTITTETSESPSAIDHSILTTSTTYTTTTPVPPSPQTSSRDMVSSSTPSAISSSPSSSLVQTTIVAPVSSSTTFIVTSSSTMTSKTNSQSIGHTDPTTSSSQTSRMVTSQIKPLTSTTYKTGTDSIGSTGRLSADGALHQSLSISTTPRVSQQNPTSTYSTLPSSQLGLYEQTSLSDSSAPAAGRTSHTVGNSTTFSQILLPTKANSSVSLATITTSLSFFTITTYYTTEISTTDENGNTISTEVVIASRTRVTQTMPSPTITSKATTTTGTDSTATLTGQQPVLTFLPSEVMVSGTFTNYSYFAAIYAVPLLAILVRAFWDVIYSNLIMMEPFERMTGQGGASAGRALFAEYLSNSISFSGYKTWFSGRPTALCSTLVSVFVTVLCALSASSMTVRARGYCPDNPVVRCYPAWTIDRTIVRCIEVLLLLSVALVLLIVILNWNSWSGLSANPSSIVAIASMLNHEELLQDFRLAETNASTNLLATAMRDRLVRLEWHSDAKGNYYYGISRTSSPHKTSRKRAGRSGGHRQSFRSWFQGYSSVSNPNNAVFDNETPKWYSHIRRSTIYDVLLLISCLGIFSVFVAYRYDFDHDALNNFFNANTIWSRLTFVSMAVVVDIQWKRLEREVRIIEPYRRLGRGFARPETTILIQSNGTCWSELPGSFFRLFRYRDMWFQTVITCIAAVSDINIIAAASLVFGSAQTPYTFKVSAWVAISITFVMVVGILLTMIYWRRQRVVKLMPRCPDTIGGICSYLCASRMAKTLGEARLESLTGRERDKLIRDENWRLHFGPKIGTDGVERWSVDFDQPSRTCNKINVGREELDGESLEVTIGLDNTHG